MGAKRAITLRVEKAELIARLDLQRADIADTWREVSEPLQSLDDTIQNFSRHSKAFGGAAAIAGVALLVSGKLHIFRRLFKVAVFAIPYIISHRSSGVIGLVITVVKKLIRRFL